jgi:hypothetical protein
MSEDGPGVLRLGERMEVEAELSKFSEEELWIGIGDIPNGTQTKFVKPRLVFRPGAPKPGHRQRSKPCLCALCSSPSARPRAHSETRPAQAGRATEDRRVARSPRPSSL